MAGRSFDDPDVVDFLDKAYKMIKEEALQEGTRRDTPVVEFKHPHELQSAVNIAITPEPAGHDQLLDEMRKIIRYSVKTGHPHFHNQMYGSLDPYSQVGSWLTSSLNANIHTFEACPVFIVMEKYLFQKMSDLLGFKHGDGLFCPGGSASNFFAFHLARFRKFPEAKANGMYGLPRMRCYTSENGHYSLLKGAIYLGFGVKNVVKVKTDDRGSILVEDLEKCVKSDIEKGYVPLFVMATSGSTVLGSFDDLSAVSAVCKNYGIWLHSDACWGAGALLSRKHKHIMAGSHLCDSVAWNFHKFSGVPVQCSALLVNDPSGRLMQEANSAQAEYLFQPDKFYDTSFDVGDKTVQCGRMVDVVKLWMQWRALGDDGMEARIDKAFDNAHYITEKIKSTDGFRIVMPEFQCTNVCFWYIPHRLRGQKEDDKWWQELHAVAPKLKERMMESGTMMLAYQPLTYKGLVNFFRIIIHNPLCTHEDMDFILQEFERLGHDL